ncbi:MAG: shikimate dehydrogenase [Chloroflexi bacterium]|nr:shikimate dehydrogenase [Chloroflexota bacterium]MCA2001934.1 shikimate dehydrogenase [Chloroflexota bacterium]
MDSFAFIIHPIDPKRDVSRKFPFLGRILNERQIDFFSTFFPPVYISEIEGVTSAATGKVVKGWFIACPYTPRRMMELPVNAVYRKIIQTGRMAERLGADILGLGAFTSVVGDAGLTIAKALDIPVTTGDSFTVAMAVQAIRDAARAMEIRLEEATVAVVGATGAIGRVCAELLAGEAARLLLIARDENKLARLRERLSTPDRAVRARSELVVGSSMEMLKDAQLILTVTSSIHDVIRPQYLQAGSVVCDVARPRDVSAMVAAARDDILVIDGGMVDVPGPVNFNFDFGFPEGKAYACMAETIALTLEGRFEDYTVGKDITLERVREITAIAERHGFRMSGFRSFEREVTQEQIEIVRKNARRGLSRA